MRWNRTINHKFTGTCYSRHSLPYFLAQYNPYTEKQTNTSSTKTHILPR